MADTFTTITTFINSPPGQVVAGGVLAGIVWKFFGRVENVLNEDTKLEIAVWLLGVRTAARGQSAPQSFISLADRMFGERKISWRSLWRSCLATYASIAICGTLNLLSPTARTKAEMLLPPGANAIVLGIALIFALPILFIVFAIT